MGKEMSLQEQEILNLLKAVIDPELMVNIVDLGLVYATRLMDAESRIEIDMTLTSQGCPLGDVIIEDVNQVISAKYPNHRVEVNLVWEPEWTLERLTTEGKEALGRD